MANSDDAFFQTNIQSPLDLIHKQLRIQTMLMREAWGLQSNEDSSLTQQSLPTGTLPITYTP